MARHATVTVTPEPYVGDQPPPPADGRVFDAVVIGRTAVGVDGWRQPLPEVTVYCTLTSTSGQWRVDDIQTSISEAGS